MDRRILVTIVVLAGAVALLLALSTSPDTGPPGPLDDQAGPDSRDQGLRGTTAGTHSQVSGTTTGSPPSTDGAARSNPAPLPPIGADGGPGLDITEPEPGDGTLASQCQQLQVHANLIEDMVRLEADGLVEPSQELELATRLAALTTQVMAEDKKIRAGEMSCVGTPPIELGAAEDLLERLADHADLSDSEADEIAQALDELGQVNWD